MNAPKGSGGVGILFKNELFNSFSINAVDKTYDGILGVKFQHKFTDYTFIGISCYLPPENSPWSNNTNFLSHLISQLYIYGDVDNIFIAGDFNSRVGKLQDGIKNIDDISVRSSRDGVVNNYGRDFIDFIKDTKLCILNGRITPEYDDFTCVSSRGRSVVDYILSPQLSLKSCKLCKVQPVKELIGEFQLQHLIGERCRPPDHSVLSLIFVISSVPEVKQQYDVSLNKMYEANDEQMQTDSNCILQRRYKLNNFPVDFQNNEIWFNALVEIISFLQTCNDTQQEIDIIYEKLCTTFYKEMATYLSPIKTTTGCKVKCKYYKPYWDEELSVLWKNAIYNEKVFRKYKGSLRRKQDISLQYQISLRSFDKALRKKKRLYRRKNAEKI